MSRDADDGVRLRAGPLGRLAEAAEWFAFTDAVESELEKSSGTITVPADFLRRAIDQIKAEPLMFQHMREAHDRLRAGEGN